MKKTKENINIEKISELLKKAPTDDGTFYGAIYDLNVFIGIVRGVNSIVSGKGMTLEEFNKEREALYEQTLSKCNSRRFS